MASDRLLVNASNDSNERGLKNSGSGIVKQRSTNNRAA